ASAGSIAVTVENSSVTLWYKRRSSAGNGWTSEQLTVVFVRTECNYGGTRPWFLCPECGRRAAILYAASTFACGKCQSLRYESQRRHRKWRLFKKALAIRAKLGGSLDLFEPFPWRPKYMHWKKYWRLREAAFQAREAYFAHFAGRIQRLEEQIKAWRKW